MAASRQSTTPHVAAVFSRYPGQNLTPDSIVSILRDEYQVDRTRDQVRDACSRLANDPRFPDIRSVQKGVYTLTESDEEDDTDRVFSEVGATKDGRLVLECTDGSLYVAEQL